MSRYDITNRLHELGMKQTRLLEILHTQYGEHVEPSAFSKMKQGHDRSPKAERVVLYASNILAERERLLGISNAYTKEA
jgi:hypothetical protein